MYIDPKLPIAGFPAIKIRDLLRKQCLRTAWHEDSIKFDLQLSSNKTIKLLKELETLGYIESTGTAGYWKNTAKGNALGFSSAARPISMATANRVLKEFLERVQTVNAEPNYLFYVKKAVVLGSFLYEKDKISHIDIGISLEPKEADRDKHIAFCRERTHHALNKGRRFDNFVSELRWPEDEILMFLKHQSRAIWLHSIEDIPNRMETHTVFERERPK